MRDDVCAFYGVDGDTKQEARAVRLIQEAVESLNRRKLWKFNLYTTASFNTAAGTSTYSLTTMAPDLWKVYSLRKTDASGYSLTGMRQAVFDRVYPGQAGITGYPSIRVDFNIYRTGTLELFPPPDAVYPMLLRYFKLIARPTDLTAAIDMPQPYQNIPKYMAMSHMAQFVGDSAKSQGEYWKREYEQAYEEMKEMDEGVDDEMPRFITSQELEAYEGNYLNPASRPALLDFY
jgi:hypothetical protein